MYKNEINECLKLFLEKERKAKTGDKKESSNSQAEKISQPSKAAKETGKLIEEMSSKTLET